MVVIWTEDLLLSIRVQLFSRPQQQEAASTSSEPVLNWNPPIKKTEPDFRPAPVIMRCV